MASEPSSLREVGNLISRAMILIIFMRNGAGEFAFGSATYSHSTNGVELAFVVFFRTSFFFHRHRARKEQIVFSVDVPLHVQVKGGQTFVQG